VMIQRALRLEGEICGVETIVLGASSHALDSVFDLTSI